MDTEKLEQLQKMYEDGLITESDLKSKREKIISEIIDKESVLNDEKCSDKSKSKRKYLLYTIIFSVLIVLIGLIDFDAIFDDNDIDSTSAAEKEEKSTNKIGKWIDYSEKEEVKIYSVVKTGYISEYLIAPDGKYYLKCKVGCRNISDRPLQSFANQKYTLISPTGVKYFPDENVRMIQAYSVLSDIFSGNSSSFVLQPYEAYKEDIAFLISDKEVSDSGWKIVVDNKIEISIKF